MKISVVINTYNAEEFLEEVLESVKFFDEVLICDMYSTDRTIEIAKKYNCRIIYFERVGGIPEPARTYAIKSASYEWVLMIDSDEYIPAALREYFYEQIKRPDCPDGIRFPRKNYFMGRFMRSTYPDYILRFFKRDLTEWPPTVHSKAQVRGQVETIPQDRHDLACIHLPDESVETRVRKTNTYTTFEFERRKEKTYGYWALIFHPVLRFFRFYIGKGGFKDGKPGFIWAVLSAYYKFITIAKVIEPRMNRDDIKNRLK